MTTKPTTLSEIADLMTRCDDLAQLYENERYELEDAERDARRALERLRHANHMASLKAHSIHADLSMACVKLQRIICEKVIRDYDRRKGG